MAQGYLLDTNVFNRLLDEQLHLGANVTDFKLYATHVQYDELSATSNLDRRANLLKTFEEIGPASIPTSSAVWDVSRYGEAEWGSSDGLFERMSGLLNDMNGSKKNNGQDVLIAETAIRRGLVLVTDDRHLAEVMRQSGGEVITTAELLSKVQ